MTDAQLRFLRLHAHHLVTRWVWLFGDTNLRAFAFHTKRSVRSATIHREELMDLIGFGFMEPGHGYADVRITEAGKAVAEESQEQKVDA